MLKNECFCKKHLFSGEEGVFGEEAEGF